MDGAKECGGMRRCGTGQITVCILFLLVCASVVLAQLPTATVLGLVKDNSGAVVPSSTLTARNLETGQSRAAVSAGDGSYRFAALPVGTYEIRVEHPGFQTEVRSLTLAVGQEAVVNFSLQVGAVEQTVAVTAEAPLVNTTSGSLGSLVSAQKVSDLPLNGRNFVNLTLLQPGITQNMNMGQGGTIAGTWYNSNGAPVRSNNYLLDGAIMQNFQGGSTGSASGSTLGIEGIREWRVITNSFSAEYGTTMGSQTVIVTKSGTNAFHGSGFEFLRNNVLDARNFFDLKTPVTPNRLPQFRRNNFGGSFGGPVKKDRLFFFATYEGLRERLGRTVVSNTIPLAAKRDGGVVPQIAPAVRPLLALFPDPNLPNDRFTFPAGQPIDEDFGQGRVDYAFSDKDTAFGRFTDDDTRKSVPESFPQFRQNVKSVQRYLTVSENHVFSPTLLNTARFSYSFTLIAALESSGVIGPQVSFFPGREVGTINIGGVTALGPGPVSPNNQTQNIFTWSDDLFYTRGAHSLKIGALFNRYQAFVTSGRFFQGQATFASVGDFLQARPSVILGVTPGSIIDRTFHWTTAGAYLQDDWRVRPNLTLNIGVRYEATNELNESKGLGVALRDVRHDAKTTLGNPFINPTLGNVSPRLGFAWDIRGDGHTAVRGGFGLLYDLSNPASALSSTVSATPPFSSISTVAGPAAANLFSIPFFFPASAAGNTLSIIDYRFKQPYLMQYNLTVERQLPFQAALKLSYVGTRGVHIIQDKEGNPTASQILPDGRRFFPANAPLTNPNFGTINFVTGGSNSFYNAFQFELLKRTSHGLQFQSAYTFSKTIDETQGQAFPESTGSSVFSTDPNDRRVDRGLAAFDVKHNWRLNAIYRLPQPASSGGALGKLLNGWWTSGILSVQGGLPFTPVLQANRSRSGVNGGQAGIDRPDLKPGRSNDNIILGGPDRYFDPTAFTVPAAGFLGNAGRNILRGPGFATLDFTLAKDTPVPYLGESGKLEFRAEFFNITNRPNFTTPGVGNQSTGAGNNAGVVFAGRSDVESPLPTAGRITSTISTSRQIQFSLKLLF